MKIKGSSATELNISGKCTIGEAFKKNGIYMPAQCGSRGMCGKCRIRVTKGSLPVTESDKRCISKENLDKGVRLACMAVLDADMSRELEIELLWSTEESIHVLGDTISETLDESDAPDEEITGTADTPGKELGIAVDIGTTTLALSLVDMVSRKVMDTVTGINHQRSFGADVISRIQASNDGNADILKESIQKDLNEAIDTLLDRNSADKTKLSKIVIAGNTTMQHLLMGYSCEGLGVYPFTAVTLAQENFTAERVLERKDLNNTIVTMLPGVSAYVGADITAGMYATGFMESDKPLLLIDLGTNGEMAIGNKDKILVTSTAAGPAFEGGNISCGVGSIPGAVCSVRIDDDTKIPSLTTIDDKEPIGLCGTGVVETVAELVRMELIDETGMLDEDYFDDGYELSENIVFTQKDVREIQLAKSAVRAGMEVLMDSFGTTCGELGGIYIAGGFGYYLDLKKAAEIGLISEEALQYAKSAGNTSLKGAILALTDEKALDTMPRIAAKAEEVALSTSPLFNDLYMEYMMFGENF